MQPAIGVTFTKPRLRSESVSLWVAHQFNVNNLRASAEHNKTWQHDRLLYFHGHFPLVDVKREILKLIVRVAFDRCSDRM